MTEPLKERVERKKLELLAIVNKVDSTQTPEMIAERLAKAVMISEHKSEQRGILHTQECRVLCKDPCVRMETLTAELSELEKL